MWWWLYDYLYVKKTHTPELNPSTYSQLIYNKGGKNIPGRKNSLFNNAAGSIAGTRLTKMAE